MRAFSTAAACSGGLKADVFGVNGFSALFVADVFYYGSAVLKSLMSILPSLKSSVYCVYFTVPCDFSFSAYFSKSISTSRLGMTCTEFLPHMAAV